MDRHETYVWHACLDDQRGDLGGNREAHGESWTMPGNSPHGLVRKRAELYVKKIYERGAPLNNCFGFIDCKLVKRCRPGGRGTLQRASYSGHKWVHCLIYQTITTPYELLFYIFGPEMGRRHDMTLYRHSGLEPVLEEVLIIDRKQYCIYGDATYLLRAWLQMAFRRSTVTPDQILYNRSMSTVREAWSGSIKT